MQVIVLAAGMGLRLRHETADRPKCMVEVSGVSMLQRSLDNIARFSVSRIVLVVGYQGDRIRDFVGGSYKGIPVVYIENREYATTNNIYSLYLARNLMAEDDTLLLESDIVYELGILEKLLADAHPNIAVVDKYRPHMDGTVVKISALQEITAIIPKAHFNPEEVDSYYKTVNIYKFSRSFSSHTYLPFLEAYCAALGHNRFYEQVLRVILTLDQNNLRAMVLDGEKWFEIDTIPDLRDAELLFPKDRAEKKRRITARYGGYWRLGGLRDFCYLTNPFFMPEGLVQEFRRETPSLLCGYPSGQETQCLLAGELFSCREEKLAVGNGASEIIVALSRLARGRIGLFYPAFMEYPIRFGERIVPLRPAGKGLRYGADDLIDAAENVDCLLLVNPDNPSGNFIPRNKILDVVARYRELGKQVIIDESFVDFAGRAEEHDLLHDDILDDNPNLVVVRSISKTYNVPGVRLGVVASSRSEFIRDIRRELAIWNINAFGEFFLQIAPKYATEYRKACRDMADERERVTAALAGVSFLDPLHSRANHILCKLTGGWTSDGLATYLLHRHDVHVKSFSKRPGLEDGEYVRIGIRLPEDNQFLVQCLHGAVNVDASKWI